MKQMKESKGMVLSHDIDLHCRNLKGPSMRGPKTPYKKDGVVDLVRNFAEGHEIDFLSAWTKGRVDRYIIRYRPKEVGFDCTYGVFCPSENRLEFLTPFLCGEGEILIEKLCSEVSIKEVEQELKSINENYHSDELAINDIIKFNYLTRFRARSRSHVLIHRMQVDRVPWHKNPFENTSVPVYGFALRAYWDGNRESEEFQLEDKEQELLIKELTGDGLET